MRSRSARLCDPLELRLARREPRPRRPSASRASRDGRAAAQRAGSRGRPSTRRASRSRAARRASPRASRRSTVASIAAGSSSKPRESSSASSKRPCMTRISARRAAGWMQRGLLSCLGQLAQRGLELLLGVVDPSARGVDVGAARAAEREQRHVVVRRARTTRARRSMRPAARCRLRARTPETACSRRPRTSRGTTARRSVTAAMASSRRARPVLDVPDRDLREAQLCERVQLEVGVPRLERHVQRRLRVAAPTTAVARALLRGRGRATPARLRARRSPEAAPPARATRSPRPRSRRPARTRARATGRCAPPGASSPPRRKPAYARSR